MDVQSSKESNYSAEFMLREYDRIHALLMNENSQAEQRVSFFLTIASAAIGAFFVISNQSAVPKQVVYVATQTVLIASLLFGLTFLNRLNMRNAQGRVFLLSLAEVQNYFARRDTTIATYLERQKKIYQHREHRFKLTRHILRWLTGGLIYVMILWNALICGGITWAALADGGYAVTTIVVWTTVTVIVAIVLLYSYSRFIARRLPVWKYY